MPKAPPIASRITVSTFTVFFILAAYDTPTGMEE
jgi:hypothetical protein